MKKEAERLDEAYELLRRAWGVVHCSQWAEDRMLGRKIDRWLRAETKRRQKATASRGVKS